MPIQSFTGGDYAPSGNRRRQAVSGHRHPHRRLKPDLQSELAYNSTPDANRGGAYYGYHYLVDRDGKVYQTAPDNVRSRMAATHWCICRAVRSTCGASTTRTRSASRSIGGAPAGKNPLPMTPEQQAAGIALVNQLKAKYNIDPSKIVSHGELDASRASGLNPDGGAEGADFIKAYRASVTGVSKADGRGRRAHPLWYRQGDAHYT